jgi:C1A family cysteine protease
MRALILLAVCMSFALASATLTEIEVKKYLPAFDEFVHKHGKKYSSNEEFEHRFLAFVHNTKEAERLQAEAVATNSGIEYAISSIHDMFPEELVTSFSQMDTSTPDADLSDLPPVTEGTAFTWEGTSRVTPIKDQGQCGSCYIFSAVACVESYLNAATQIAEQQVLDCIPAQTGLNQCNGGWPYNVLSKMQNAGWETTSAYPYSGAVGSCKYTSAASQYKYWMSPSKVSSPSVSTMQSLVQNKGVISVVVAANSNFMYYAAGILTATACPATTVNHAVNVVGWGTDSSNKVYFIVRNSWGSWWGQSGYAYVYSDACNIRYLITYLG